MRDAHILIVLAAIGNVTSQYGMTISILGPVKILDCSTQKHEVVCDPDCKKGKCVGQNICACDPNWTEDKCNEQFWDAAAEGDLAFVRGALRQGSDPNFCNQTYYGNTVLHIAAVNGHESIIRTLVDAGANLELQTSQGYTALHLAAQENYESIVQVLLDAGVNKDLKAGKDESSNDQDGGETPVIVAATFGSEAALLVLIDAKANLEQKNDFGLTALHLATQKDDGSIVQILLDAGADKDVIADKIESVNVLGGGETPIIKAAHYDSPAALRVLIDAGANMEMMDDIGFTALHIASERNHESIVQILLDAGANKDVKSDKVKGQDGGKTPLLIAANFGSREALHVLLKARVNLELKDNLGFTALHAASQRNFESIVQDLLDAGANKDVKTGDKGEWTPVFQATKFKCSATMTVLINNGADVNIPDSSGETPLMVAVDNGIVSAVRDLLAAGADVNAQTVWGYTALHYAAIDNHKDIALLLLENGADKDAEDYEYETPGYWAKDNGHHELGDIIDAYN